VNLTQLTPIAAVLCELMCNKGHMVVQGHSRSPILIPIDSHMQLPISELY